MSDRHKILTLQELNEMDIVELVVFIQPLWNKFRLKKSNPELTLAEQRNLTAAFKVYQAKGGDVEYFTTGAGAPGNCTLF